MEVFVPGPVGRLEAVFERPDAGALRGAAVVCHPHPEHGGTLQNTIVYRTARALREAGLATLRFNFRGVGASEGSYHGEGGEEDDAAACLDYLERECPGVPLWGGGYSFGARTVGSRAVRDARVHGLVLIAPPVLIYDCDFLRRIEQPALVLFGSEDEFGTLSAFREQFGDLGPHVEADEVPGADHFFRGRTPRVEERVLAFAQRSLESAT